MTHPRRVLALSSVLALVVATSATGRVPSSPTLVPSGQYQAVLITPKDESFTGEKDKSPQEVWEGLRKYGEGMGLESPVPSSSPQVSAVPRRTPDPKPNSSSVKGIATWYCLLSVSRCPAGYAGGMYAAAGPALRVGDWRGRTVTVSSGNVSIQVTLVDWCACGNGRVIDLFGDAFGQLAPLSRGVLPVTVSW